MPNSVEGYLKYKAYLQSKITNSEDDYIANSPYELELEYLEMWYRLFLME